VTYTLRPLSESDLAACPGVDSSNPPYCWREFEEVGAADKITALNDADPLTGIRNIDETSTTYNGIYGLQGIFVDPLDPAISEDATITRVEVFIKIRAGTYGGAPAGSLDIGRSGGSSALKAYEWVASGAVIAAEETISHDFTSAGPADKAEGALWTVADVNRIEVVVRTDDSAPYPVITDMYVEVDVEELTGLDAGIEAARDIATRHLRQYRPPVPMVELSTNLRSGLPIPLGAVVAVQHRDFPSEDGNGSGIEPVNRWRGRVVRKTVDPGNNTVTLTLRSLRHFLVLVWYRALVTLSGIETLEGVARMLSGQTWLPSRGTTGYVDDPGGGGVISVSGGRPKIDALGHLVEPACAPLLLNSSCALGIAVSWSNSGTVTETTAVGDLIGAISGKAWAIAAASYIEQATASLGTLTETRLTVSVDHKDASAANPAKISLQRSSDSKWYRASDQTWQGAEVKNPLTGSTSFRRDAITFDVGATPGTITVRGHGDAGATVIGHVQLENRPWASSRVKTSGTLTPSKVDRLACSNDFGVRAWNVDHGVARVTVAALWSSADVASGGYLFTALWLPFDASNWIWLRYEGAAGEWKFTRCRAGASSTNSLAAAVTARTPVEVVVRWCGANGELGLDPYTQSMFVDGTQADNVTAAGHPLEALASTLDVGSGNGGVLAGAIQALTVTQQVLSDSECKRPD
jgi:hypothetical protein